MRQASDLAFDAFEGGENLQHEGGSVILEFGDLDIERNRIALVEAMVFDRVLPGDDSDVGGLEVAFMKLPRSAMRKVVTTAAQMAVAHSERAALLLKGFEARNVAQGDL